MFDLFYYLSEYFTTPVGKFFLAQYIIIGALIVLGYIYDLTKK